MGNIASMARASTALDSYVAELGNDISYDKSLSSSRFLKTILARHANGPLVLKIFIKPDPNMSLRLAQRRLKNERKIMAGMHNVNTYQMFVETDKAGYLIRQWIGHNLYDRVSVQPYLAEIEKKWIAFQLLTCLRDTRIGKVAHGDIKSENVLITSDLTVVLTDFSYTFKPTYLPIDDPSDFSFFFDTSGRRTCYLAPERFETRHQREQRQTDEKRRLEERRKRKLAEAKRKAGEKRRGSTGHPSDAEPFANLGSLDTAYAGRDLAGEMDEVDEDTLAAFRPQLTEEMDVFSAGCVLAEMWTDGRTVFNLSEMFAYKDGSLGLEGVLDNIGDHDVQSMISQMLSLDPSHRLRFDRILSDYRGTVFPEYFYTFLQDYVNSLAESTRSPEGDQPTRRSTADFLSQSAPSAGTKIDRMLNEWDSISVHLEEDAGEGAALLLLNIVTSSIRNCSWPSSRLHGLELFLKLLPFLSDEDKVDRVVPFAVELLKDPLAEIRGAACRTIITVVESLTYITPANAAFIPEYLLPQMRDLTMDQDVSVRATYAGCLVNLADAARNVLELNQAAKTPRNDPEASGVIEPDYDEMLAEIVTLVEDQVTIILRDEAVPVKCAILTSIPNLCVFFGRQRSTETVLSHLVTYLNDREWTLRLAFFSSIVQVGPVIGLRAVEDYFLPLMLQSLADPEEAVVAQVIQGFISLDRDGWVKRMSRWDVFAAVRGFLCHPNTWIRQGASGYIAAAAAALSPADVWCIMYPNIRPLLRHDIVKLDEQSILAALSPPLSRAKLVAARTAAMENRPDAFWSPAQHKGSSKHALTRSALNEKLSQAPQLRDKDIDPKDECKIVAMRDFIFKQSQSVRRRQELEASKQEDSSDLSNVVICLANDRVVQLGTLGVLPQTVFISPRTVTPGARNDLRRLRPLFGSDRDTPSRRTSVAGKSTRGVDSPLDEIRRRLQADAVAQMSSANSAADPREAESTATPSEPGGSGFEIQPSRSGKVRVDAKAAPAVAAVHANALGVTSIHDDLMSGQTTPTAGILGGSRHLAMAGNTGYGSSYDGHDPGVKAFLEQVDLDTYREPLLDFGPRVVASQRKRARTKNNTASPITLIAHLTQHTASITGIITSPDQAFFVTASTDKSVLVWDSGRLERSVSAKPRLTYMMDAPVSAICRIENTHCIVVCAEDGQMHVLRMHVSKGEGGSVKYGKVECIRTWCASERDGHVTYVSHLRDSTLLIATSSSVVAVIDIRSMEITNRYRNPLEMGTITAVHQSTDWVLVGTELGILNLWDLRFGLLLKSWRVGGSVTSLDVHPTKGHGRWIVCGVHRKHMTSPLVEVYDVESSQLVEVYESRTERPSSKHPYPLPTPSATIPGRSELVAELADKRATIPDFDEDRPAVLSLATGSRFASLPPPEEGSILDVRSYGPAPQGYMITAGQDKIVRYFDLAKPSDGMVICGSAKQKDVVFKSTTVQLATGQADATGGSNSSSNAASSSINLTYTLPRTAEKVHPTSDARAQERQKLENVRETLGGRQPLRPHFDAVCALGTVETGVSSCVISGDRGGVVKVWRIEGGGK